MMLKLIKKVSIFASLWFVLTYLACLFMPLHYFNAEYPMWKSKMEVIMDDTPVENIVIGDSRAIAGIDVGTLGKEYYNLALGGATPMEGYYMLKKLLAQNKKLDTILVSYAPIHFEQSEMFWDRQLKYGFYNVFDIRQIFEQLNTGNHEFWRYEGAETYGKDEIDGHIARAYLNYAKFPTTLRTELGKSLLLRGAQNYQVYQQIKQQRGTFEFGKQKVCHELNIEAKREEFRPQKVLIKSLVLFFDLAERHGITVVWLNMPMNQSSYAALNPKYREGVMAFMEKLERRYPQVHFLGKPMMPYDDTYFGDPSHLNELGRQKFTSTLKKQLQYQFEDGRTAVTNLYFER